MTGIVFLRNSMILISSLIVRLLLIVFSLARYIVKRFSKIMLMVCVCSIRRRRIRCNLLNISGNQRQFFNNVSPGSGLMKYGGILVPFVNQFPKDTKLYQLITTKPNEMII